ncbi:coenzyme F420-0:L-glutamate ligase [Streptomyces sp. NPDC085929]|uniref:coenzyme F420-0:L-glutamate ligase n=1 Tax=Streptomyces sp. NPDC085929 TaxID=3365739 RepID=UPI0037D05881
MTTACTSGFSAFALEPFGELRPGDDLSYAIADVLTRTRTTLHGGDIVVVASKVVSIAEKRYVDLTRVIPSPDAVDIAARTGEPAEMVQLMLENSTRYFLVTERGPIIAWHTLGFQLVLAGINRAGTDGAWLLPRDPDASAVALRNALIRSTGVEVAVVIADSDGRADRRGTTVISIGAAGITPLRTTEYKGKREEETLTDMIAAAAGIVLGQRGRGVPVAVLRGITYTRSNEGVAALLHQQP